MAACCSNGRSIQRFSPVQCLRPFSASIDRHTVDAVSLWTSSYEDPRNVSRLLFSLAVQRRLQSRHSSGIACGSTVCIPHTAGRLFGGMACLKTANCNFFAFSMRYPRNVSSLAESADRSSIVVLSRNPKNWKSFLRHGLTALLHHWRNAGNLTSKSDSSGIAMHRRIRCRYAASVCTSVCVHQTRCLN